jgi:hypothetical protein
MLIHQMWIHERFDIGRPRTDLSEYELTAPTQRTSPPWVLCGVSGK